MTSRSASRPVSSHSRSSASNSRREVAGRRRELGRARPRRSGAGRPGRPIEVADVEALAHDLAVDLALGRHVDHGRRRGRAPCSRAGGPAARPLLGARTSPRARRAARGASRHEVMPCFGELAVARLDLAAAADPAAAADRVDVDAERAGGVEDGRARRRTGRAGPDGVKMTSASSATGGRSPVSRAGRRPRPRRRRRPAGPARPRRRVARLAAIQRPQSRVVAHQHVGGHDRVPHLGVQRVRDRRGQPGGDRHRQERGVDALPVRQPEAHVRGAAGAC